MRDQRACTLQYVSCDEIQRCFHTEHNLHTGTSCGSAGCHFTKPSLSSNSTLTAFASQEDFVYVEG
eukprot:768816-Hanusia_phi.AAC.3